jgi:hypothetical protein
MIKSTDDPIRANPDVRREFILRKKENAENNTATDMNAPIKFL